MSPVTSCLHNSLQQNLNWLIQTVASMFPLVRIPGRLLKGSHSDLICINTIRQNVSVLHKVHLIQNPIVAIKSFTISIGWSGMFQGFRDNKAAKVAGKSGYVPPSRSWRFLLVRFLRRKGWMVRHEDTQDVGWRLFCLCKMWGNGSTLVYKILRSYEWDLVKATLVGSLFLNSCLLEESAGCRRLKVSIYSYIYFWVACRVGVKHVGEHHPEVSSVDVQTLLGCLPAFRVLL